MANDAPEGDGERGAEDPVLGLVAAFERDLRALIEALREIHAGPEHRMPRDEA